MTKSKIEFAEKVLAMYGEGTEIRNIVSALGVSKALVYRALGEIKHVRKTIKQYDIYTNEQISVYNSIYECAHDNYLEALPLMRCMGGKKEYIDRENDFWIVMGD